MPEVVGHTPDGGVIYRREDGSEITVPGAVLSGFGLTPGAFGAVDQPPRDEPIDPFPAEMKFEPDLLPPQATISPVTVEAPPPEPVEEFAPDVLPPAQRKGFETTEEERARAIAEAQRRGLPTPEFDERGFPIAGSDATPPVEPSAEAPFVQVSSKGPFISDPERAAQEAQRQAALDEAAGFVPQDPFAQGDAEAAAQDQYARDLRQRALSGDPQAIAELEAASLARDEELTRRNQKLAEREAEAQVARATRDEAAAAAFQRRKAELEQEKSERLAKARAEIEDTNAELNQLAETDPNRFWATRSTGQKLALYAATFISGLFAPYHGGRNMTLDLIERAIDRDIAAQKSTFQQKSQVANHEVSAYQRLREKFGDEELALSALKAAQYERSAAIMAGEMARIGVDRTDLAGDQLRAALNERARAFGLQAAKRRQELELQRFNQEKANQALDIDRGRLGVSRGQLNLGRAKLEEDKRRTNLGITAKLLENAAKAQKGAAGDPRAINVSGMGLETPDGEVYVARSEKNADNVVGLLNGSAGVVRLLDQALALGDIENAFPWAQRRNLRKQIMEQIKLNIILAGGRSISDQDVVTLEKAVGSADPDQFLKLISNETGREQLRNARRLFARKLVTDAIAHGAADRGYSPSTVRFNPPPAFKPGEVPKIRGEKGARFMVEQLGSSDPTKVISAMAFMADFARRNTNAGDLRYKPSNSAALSRVAVHQGRAMDDSTRPSVNEYMAAAHAALAQEGNPDVKLYADQFYEEYTNAVEKQRQIQEERTKRGLNPDTGAPRLRLDVNKEKGRKRGAKVVRDLKRAQKVTEAELKKLEEKYPDAFTPAGTVPPDDEFRQLTPDEERRHKAVRAK